MLCLKSLRSWTSGLQQLLRTTLLKAYMLVSLSISERRALIESLSVDWMIRMSWMARMDLLKTLLHSLISRMRDSLACKSLAMEWVISWMSSSRVLSVEKTFSWMTKLKLLVWSLIHLVSWMSNNWNVWSL